MIVPAIVTHRLYDARAKIAFLGARHTRLAKRSDKRRVYIAPFRRFHALRAGTSDVGAG